MKKLDNKRIAKKLGIKILKLKDLKKYGLTIQSMKKTYGWIPGGLSIGAVERKIWLHSRAPTSTFIHECIHVLLGHEGGDLFGKSFCTEEIECDSVVIEICKALDLPVYRTYLNKWKRRAYRKKYNIKLRNRKMKQVFNQFMEAVG